MDNKETIDTNNRRFVVLLIGAILVVGAISFFLASRQSTEPGRVETGASVIPEQSTFFAVADVEERSTMNTDSDGDLWPSAWANDDAIYSANGDGKGFDLGAEWQDIVVNRILGDPSSAITGARLAAADQVGQVWNDPDLYNRKPTGMVAVGDDLYLAVQDLRKNPPEMAFNDVPSATILKSVDHGATWTWDTSAPMFDDYNFTTIFFLDYGKGGADNTFDEYVYAYGLDYNWRDSFSNTVTDPTRLYLARVPKDGIQNHATWEFYTGDLQGNAQWSSEMRERRPVLQDDRRVYSKVVEGVAPNDMTVISQGSVVYNKPLNRYMYTSWTEYTFEFYEAPTPWGPWRLFLSKDFGAYPWYQSIQGGYGTVILPKFTSDDGRTMWLNSNTFMGGISNYNFSLRQLHVVPWVATTPSNERGAANLALPENSQDVTPVSRARFRFGRGDQMNDGDLEQTIDMRNGEIRDEDWWGYNWSQAYNMNELVYTTGDRDLKDGGWFTDLRVQVRQEFEWIDVTGLTITPEYPFDNTVGEQATYTLTFDDTWGDGVRLIGIPGGASTYTSFAELEVYFR